MKGLTVVLTLIPFAAAFVAGCASGGSDEERLREFIAKHVATVQPKLKAQSLADWNANATGEKRYYDESAAMELEVKTLRSDPKEFAFLKEVKEAGSVRDSLLSRQLVILYNSYLKNQLDPALLRAMVDQQTKISSTFNTFRGMIGGRAVGDNEIYGILKSEQKSDARREAWEASKQVGQVVAPMIVELVKLRNQAARQLGFQTYYGMALATDEQDPADILGIFDSLQLQTDKPFRELKAVLDASLAKRFGVAVEELRPWHYEDPFFQEPQSSSGVDFDRFFKGRDVVEIGRIFYAGLGLPVEDILKNSDLYPKKGKYQHAFESDIDREGDVRVMLNVEDNLYWMSTMLHELGHAVYSKYVDRQLPFLLRAEAHLFLTEAVAQLMERQAYDPEWLQIAVGISEKDKAEVKAATRRTLRAKQLIFSRWSQVMLRFERALYENPDQDLNKLWWDLVERFQGLRRPEGRNEPDWAAKIHLAQYPCYYHNYMLGELAASQIMDALRRSVGETAPEFSFTGKPAVGQFLQQNVFRPGMRLHWNELLLRGTGRALDPRFFVREFVEP